MSTTRTPIAITAVLITGACASILGFGSAWMLKPDEVRTVTDEVPVEVAANDAQAQDELSQAQNKVSDLERTVATQERQVNELEEQIQRGAVAGKALRAELAAVKAQLAETEQALTVALQEKEEVLEQLKKTTEQLEQTEVKLAEVTVQRDDAREDAMYNRWQDFVKGAQLEICDRGGRKKLGNCREVVAATVRSTENEARFAHCLRSGQAQPTVRELDKGTELPTFSSMIDEEQKQTKGWYVEFCDPTLPENPDLRLAYGRLSEG